MLESLYIVTGSSKGIGKALVRLLLKKEHHQVIGISRSADLVAHPNYLHIPLDLGNFDLVIQNLDSIFPVGNYKRVALINNAGWIGEINYLGKISSASIKSVFDINVSAPALLMNEFIRRYGAKPGMEKIVLNISSGAAQKSIDGWSGYCASKAALNAFTLIAHEEAKINGSEIRFFAVSPGVVDTEMQQDIRSAPKDGFTSLNKFQELKKNKQLSAPETIAKKMIYLADNTQDFEDVIQDLRTF